MISKVVIIPDSFKNTMDSRTVGSIICDVIQRKNNELNVSVYPVADGGEGTALIFSEYLKLNIMKMKTTNAFNKEIEIIYGSNGMIGVIDIASVVGFDANEGEELNPQIATTYGIGKVIKKMIATGHKKIYVGLGGSITNDLGAGMLSALGIKFYNHNEQVFIPCGKTLKNVKRVDASDFTKLNSDIICLTDVQSPLFGPTGAAKMFAKQKGASAKMIEELEEDSKIFVEVIKENYEDYSDCFGSGAAGGLGYAFKTFLKANMVSGIDEILKISNVGTEINQNTLIITGEGKFDNQSLGGKVISGVMALAKKKHAKVIVIAGCVENVDKVDGIEKVFACSKLGRSLEEIKKTCREDLAKTTDEVYNYLENEKYLSN